MCQYLIHLWTIGLIPRLAGKSLLKIIKRWPSLISKSVVCLSENLKKRDSPEYAVLGSCAVLSTQTVLKHLTAVSLGVQISANIILKCEVSFYLSLSFFILDSRTKRHFLHFSLAFFQGNPEIHTYDFCFNNHIIIVRLSIIEY